MLVGGDGTAGMVLELEEASGDAAAVAEAAAEEVFEIVQEVRRNGQDRGAQSQILGRVVVDGVEEVGATVQVAWRTFRVDVQFARWGQNTCDSGSK